MFLFYKSISLQVNTIYITPNNVGAVLLPQVEFVDLDVNNFEV